MEPTDQFTGTKPMAASHAFDVAALERHLAATMPGFAGPLTVEQFKGGQSNPTYKVTTPGAAYVLRRNLAVQFHPELTSGMLHGWLDNGGDVQAVRAGFDPAQMYADTVAEDPASRARAYALVDTFLDRIARP